MRDFAKEVTTEMHNGRAVIPYWQHELTMRKETDRTKKIIKLAASMLIATNAAWILATKKH